MKTLHIFEPAMCCPTGLCGVAVDNDLLRLSGVLSQLEKKGVMVSRYNLSSAPEMFVQFDAINKILMNEGTEALPVIMVNKTIVKKSQYPTNGELEAWFDISLDAIEDSPFVTL